MTSEYVLELEIAYMDAQEVFLNEALAFSQDEGSVKEVIRLAQEMDTARNLWSSAKAQEGGGKVLLFPTKKTA